MPVKTVKAAANNLLQADVPDGPRPESLHWFCRRAFNPLAVVFRPFRLAKVFRFFEPFQEFKHGQPAKVEQMKAELFETLNATTTKQTLERVSSGAGDIERKEK